MGERRFSYGPRRGLLAATILFFGGASGLFAYLALTGEDVRLWPMPIAISGPPVFVLAGLSFAFVAAGLAQIVAGRRLGPRQLVLTDAFLEAPKSPWTRERVRVARGSIREVKETDVMGTRVVEIVFPGGKLALSNRTVGEEGFAAVREWLGRSHLPP